MRTFAVGIVAVVCAVSLSAFGQNTVVFDNQSGDPALVKLIGPTKSEMEVPNGAKAGVDAAAGQYTIKVRYGTPGNYRYSKGQAFEVTQTATAKSETTITLHKVVAGNYEAQPISESEFGDSETAREQQDATPAQSCQLAPYTNLVTNPDRISPPQKPVARVDSNNDNLKIMLKIFSLDDAEQACPGLRKNFDINVEDTVCLVCERTLTTGQLGLIAENPYIVGLSHINVHYAKIVQPDFSVPSFSAQTRGFSTSFNMFQTKTGKTIGRAVTGEGTLSYIWLIPSMKTKFKIVFPERDGQIDKKYEIAVQLSTP